MQSLFHQLPISVKPVSLQNKVVLPGDQLASIAENVRPGIGAYELHGRIYSSLVGIPHTVIKEEGEKQITVIEVRRSLESDRGYCIPYVGCIATCRVASVRRRFAKCHIICVDSSVMDHEFLGILKLEDVKMRLLDTDEIIMSVRPGDIILSRVIGFGENQRSFLLSTAENRFGVVMGMGDLGERMFPSSETEVSSSETGRTEPRKVAQVPVLNC